MTGYGAGMKIKAAPIHVFRHETRGENTAPQILWRTHISVISPARFTVNSLAKQGLGLTSTWATSGSMCLDLIAPPITTVTTPNKLYVQAVDFTTQKKIIYLVSEFVSSGKLKKNWNFWRLAFLSICWTSDWVWNMPRVAGCPPPRPEGRGRHGVGKRNYSNNVGETHLSLQ